MMEKGGLFANAVIDTGGPERLYAYVYHAGGFPFGFVSLQSKSGLFSGQAIRLEFADGDKHATMVARGTLGGIPGTLSVEAEQDAFGYNWQPDAPVNAIGVPLQPIVDMSGIWGTPGWVYLNPVSGS